MVSKAQEAGVATADDDDAESLASSFASVGRASPASSTSTTPAGQDEPPPYSLAQSEQPPTSQHVERTEQSRYPVGPEQSQQNRETNSIEQPQPSQPLQVPYHTAAATATSWTNQDPRRASTDSLIATAPPEDTRRRLLLVYVHGFMGNETSFQSFPAHVHNLLSLLLTESHVVHTKIYPRYRTKKALQLATSEFCDWLGPHQDDRTDVVLLGHSMGGLLAADVALTREPVTQLLRHRLLGTISFDTPFFGMHPGVVWSGISSVFRPPPSPLPTPPQGAIPHEDTLMQTSASDPHFNPSFSNDVHLPMRTAWGNTLHFMNKHSKNLTHATKQLVTSHVEFGSALADGKSLKTRYTKIKALDSESVAERVKALDGLACPKRTRFVNYYTASTGRPKKHKQPRTEERDRSVDVLPSVPTTEPGSRNATSRSEIAHAGQEHLLVPSDSQQQQQQIQRRGSDSTFTSIRSEAQSSASTRPTTGGSRFGYTAANLPNARSLKAPFSVENLRARSRGRSPAPSYTTLPSYTSGPRPFSPAPSYPHSSRNSSAIASTSVISTHRSPSTVSSDSTAVPTEAAPEPPSMGPAPVPSDYPKDPTAYAVAIKAYMQTSREYAMALKNYHKFQSQQRKAEAQARIKERKAALAASEEERRLELQLRKEERRRIAEAPTEETRKAEIEAMHERRRREMDLRREQYKVGMREDSLQDGSMAKAAKTERKAAHKEAKDERKAARDAIKEERKAAKDAVKEERKALKEAWKSHGKPPCSPRKGALPTSASAVSEECNIEAESTGEATELRTLSPSSTTRGSPMPEGTGSSEQKAERKYRDKKFCMLPPRDAQGKGDAAWVRVFMKDVDEVGAHTGLFFPQGITGSEAIAGQAWGERYAWLVADAADRIETWVNDEMTERLVSGVRAL